MGWVTYGIETDPILHAELNRHHAELGDVCQDASLFSGLANSGACGANSGTYSGSSDEGVSWMDDVRGVIDVYSNMLII